jgi:hypothetical protein
MAEAPSRFNQSFPSGLVDEPGDGKSAGTLERFDDGERSFAELFDGVTR